MDNGRDQVNALSETTRISLNGRTKNELCFKIDFLHADILAVAFALLHSRFARRSGALAFSLASAWRRTAVDTGVDWLRSLFRQVLAKWRDKLLQDTGAICIIER